MGMGPEDFGYIFGSGPTPERPGKPADDWTDEFSNEENYVSVYDLTSVESWEELAQLIGEAYALNMRQKNYSLDEADIYAQSIGLKQVYRKV